MTSREQWNALMRNLPDPAFMEIMNNYLGGVKTPYDKNELLNRLYARLTHEDYRNTVLSTLDSTDLKILSAARWFDRAVIQDFLNLFSTSMTPSELNTRLINLEEKLLLFFSRSGSKPGFVVTPLLPEEFQKKLSPFTLIRFEQKTPPSPKEMPIINGSFLICFFSLLKDDLKICNNDGSFKKRFTASLTEIFPMAGFSDEPNERLHLLLNALKTLGLLSESSCHWKFRIDNLEAFALRSVQEQLLWVWAALCTSRASRLESAVSLIDTLAEQFPATGGVKSEELEKMVNLIQVKMAGTEETALSAAHVARVLKLFGFFHTDGKLWYLHPMARDLLKNPRPQSPALFLHATFDANLTPDAPFSLPLALSLNCERYDSFAQLKLTDSSFRSLLKAGLSLDQLKRELEERFSIQVPQNLLFSLRAWEEEYHSLRLWEGIVLEASKDKIPLIERNTRLKSLIKRDLGEGFYLLAKEDRQEWEPALTEMGIETIPATVNPGNRKKQVQDYKLSLSPQLPMFPESSPAWEESSETETGYKETLRRIVTADPALSDDEKEEFISRIERGILYRKDQIRPGVIRKELSVVKGLDYQGKLRMIKAVLGNRSYQLEITLPTDDFDLITHRIIPRSLEQGKESQEDLLTGTELPDKPFSCPVRKISKIRKIRTSLF